MRKLHSCSNIFFSDPYVVRMEYSPNQPDLEIEAEYRKVTRSAYKLIRGTWGYSPLEHETVQVKNDHGHQHPPGVTQFNGMSQQQILSTIFNPDWHIIRRAYLCFKDEADALQFRLSISTKAIQVKIWPKNVTFTIHEITESDE